MTIPPALASSWTPHPVLDNAHAPLVLSRSSRRFPISIHRVEPPLQHSHPPHGLRRVVLAHRLSASSPLPLVINKSPPSLFFSASFHISPSSTTHTELLSPRIPSENMCLLLSLLFRSLPFSFSLSDGLITLLNTCPASPATLDISMASHDTTAKTPSPSLPFSLPISLLSTRTPFVAINPSSTLLPPASTSSSISEHPHGLTLTAKTPFSFLLSSPKLPTAYKADFMP